MIEWDMLFNNCLLKQDWREYLDNYIIRVNDHAIKEFYKSDIIFKSDQSMNVFRQDKLNMLLHFSDMKKFCGWSLHENPRCKVQPGDVAIMISTVEPVASDKMKIFLNVFKLHLKGDDMQYSRVRRFVRNCLQQLDGVDHKKWTKFVENWTANKNTPTKSQPHKPQVPNPKSDQMETLNTIYTIFQKYTTKQQTKQTTAVQEQWNDIKTVATVFNNLRHIVTIYQIPFVLSGKQVRDQKLEPLNLFPSVWRVIKEYDDDERKKFIQDNMEIEIGGYMYWRSYFEIGIPLKLSYKMMELLNPAQGSFTTYKPTHALVGSFIDAFEQMNQIGRYTRKYLGYVKSVSVVHSELQMKARQTQLAMQIQANQYQMQNIKMKTGIHVASQLCSKLKNSNEQDLKPSQVKQIFSAIETILAQASNINQNDQNENNHNKNNKNQND